MCSRRPFQSRSRPTILVPVCALVATVCTRHRRHRDPREANSTVLTIFKNLLSLPKRLSPVLKDHAFDLVHRCLPTRHRVKHKKGNPACVLCGFSDLGADSETLSHLFVSCPVACRARGLLKFSKFPSIRSAASSLSDASVSDYLFENESKKPERILALLCFSLAVWRSRWFYVHDDRPPQAG